MNDVEAVIKQGKKIHGAERRGDLFVNRLSDLPASVDATKASIKERIQTLYAAYIALASYIPDNDYWEALDDETKLREVYQKILKRMEEYREEIENFKPLEEDLK